MERSRTYAFARGGTAALLLALAACAPETGAMADPYAGTAGVEGTGAADGDGAAGGAGAEAVADTIANPAAPLEIYYDLTRFDWYRRGEPLMVGGEPYTPAGPPLRMPDDELAVAGSHGGVTFYGRSGPANGDPAVYVPVFEGYWLPFVPGETAHADE